MKLALKVFGLLSLIAVFWGLYAVYNGPDSVVQSFAENDSQAELKENVSQNSPFQGRPQGRIVTTFEVAAEADRWRSIDDTVMGGISQGELVLTSHRTGVFRGETSLENNGGFSSVRRASDDVDFTGAEAIALRLRGDGRRYQLRLHTNSSTRSINYRAEFDTRPDEWQTLRVRFQDFEPVFRGRVIEDAPTLVPTDIQQLGFLIADKQSGEFRLEVDWISVE